MLHEFEFVGLENPRIVNAMSVKLFTYNRFANHKTLIKVTIRESEFVSRLIFNLTDVSGLGTSSTDNSPIRITNQSASWGTVKPNR